MLISMTGVASAAGGSAAVAQSASAAPSVGAGVADPNSQPGADASEFKGYVGYLGANGQPAGAGAAAVDKGVTKSEKLGPVGTNPDTNSDVAGQPAANSQSDKGTAKLVRPDQTGQERGRRGAVRTVVGGQRPRDRADEVGTSACPAGSPPMPSPISGPTRRRAHRALAATLAGTGSVEDLSAYPAAGGDLHVTTDGLDALLADPAVASMSRSTARSSAELASSTARHPVRPSSTPPACSATTSTAAPRGAYQVAIIDSGVDNQHNAFTGRIVSPGLLRHRQLLPGRHERHPRRAGSADECTHSTDCDHGTHVGRHRGRRALHRWSRRRRPGCRASSPSRWPRTTRAAARWTAFFSSIDNALQRVLTLKNTHQPEHRCGQPEHRHQRHVHRRRRGAATRSTRPPASCSVSCRRRRRRRRRGRQQRRRTPR